MRGDEGGTASAEKPPRKCISQFSSVAQSCLTLCDPLNCSTPGLPVCHQLRRLLKLMSIELVMPSSLSSSVVPFSSCLQCSPASGSFQMSQFFTQVVQVLEFQLQHQSFQRYSGLISFRMDCLDLLPVSSIFSSTTVQKHQFFSTRLSL